MPHGWLGRDSQDVPKPDANEHVAAAALCAGYHSCAPNRDIHESWFTLPDTDKISPKGKPHIVAAASVKAGAHYDGFFDEAPA